MNKPLDLENVRIYSEDDVVDAIRLIGQDVYVSDDKDFNNYWKNRLIGVQVMEDNSLPFLGKGKKGWRQPYNYFILEKDAKFKKKEKEKKLRPLALL